MNINANAASSPPAPAQKPGAGSERSRAADAKDGAGGVSFLSMLHAVTAPLDASTLAVGEGLTPSGQEPGADEGAAATDLDALWPEGGVPLSAANPEPAAAAPAQLDTEAARRAAGAADAGAALADGVAGEEDLGTAADAQEQQALRAAQDSAANAAARKSAAADTSTLARQQAADAAAAARDGGDRADTASQDQDASDAAAARPLLTPQAGANAASVVSMFEAGLTGLRAGPGGRTHERGAARINHLPDAANTGFVPWSDATPGSSTPQAASPVYAPTAATPVPAAALAQKMHFWVAGGVQSAELQLDAFDGGSVDVHIAVKGDEAFVEFRSDQPQARKLLLEAMPQLKELLADEGLMLSGGFVGDSAQEQTDGGSTRAERFASARSAQLRGVPADIAAAAPVRTGSGSAVDLFV